jgi:hypothetical protein
LETEGLQKPNGHSFLKPNFWKEKDLKTINSSEREANFQRWFGDSKVVDAEGKPLVVYHGTASTGIENFESWRGVAGHFAFDPEFANNYADEAHRDAVSDGYSIEQGAGGVVYPVYLKAENIFDLRKKEHRNLVGIKEEIGSYETLEQNADAIKSAGFDSYYDFEYDSSSPPNGIGVFSPAQIKSATGNDGSFDSCGPNITH